MRMPLGWVVSVMGLVGCASIPAGRAPSSGTLGAELEEIRAKHGLPALAAAVADSNGVIATGVAGYRKTGDPTPAMLDDQWHLGSDTKAMTATLVGMLVESGQLRWDETLVELFPEWLTDMDPGYRLVTVRMLLCHRSGMPDFALSAMMSMILDDRAPMQVRADAVKELLSQPPKTKPGSTFAYSNAGYVAVGVILERVSGKAWETLIRERLFEPLHMTSCGFGPPGTPGLVDQPWGHHEPGVFRRLFGGGPDPYGPDRYHDNPPAFGPAGTVHCSLGDWARFLIVQLKGARGEPSALGLKPETLQAIQTSWPGGEYAMGWAIGRRSWASGTLLGHEGSNTFFLVSAFLAPGSDRIYMAATNLMSPGAQKAVEEAVEMMAKARKGPQEATPVG